MIEIERAWGKYPGWFDEQPRSQQVRLLGWFRVHCNPTGKPRTNKQQQDHRVVQARGKARPKMQPPWARGR